MQYVQGLDPTLKLMRSDGQEESVGIGAWSTDTMRTYLSEKLNIASA